MGLREDFEASRQELAAAELTMKSAEARVKSLQQRLEAGETTGDSLTDLSLTVYGPDDKFIQLLRTFQLRLAGLVGQPFLMVVRTTTYDDDWGTKLPFDGGCGGIAPPQPQENWRLIAGFFSGPALAVDAPQRSWGFPAERWVDSPRNKAANLFEGALFVSGTRNALLHELYLEPLVLSALWKREMEGAAEPAVLHQSGEELELLLGTKEVDRWCADGGNLEYLGYAPEHRMSHLFGMFQALECGLTPALADWLGEKRTAFAAKVDGLLRRNAAAHEALAAAKSEKDAAALGREIYDIRIEARREADRGASYGFDCGALAPILRTESNS